MRYLVLGCGLVGSAIARDLCGDTDAAVTAADLSEARLASAKHRAPRLEVKRTDLSRLDLVSKLAADADIIINATPGWLGFSVFNVLMESGKGVVDIAFFAQDPHCAAQTAKAAGTIAVFDCGVAPGLSNMFAAEAANEFESLSELRIYVGGLPRRPDNIYNYRAVFSPSDVLEEYLRPARVRTEGRAQTLPALSQLETFNSDELGSLEAFVTDGLRSLLDTISCETMVEKTLRYPGHAAQIKLLLETGLLSDRPISVGAKQIVPREMTAALLFPIWAFRAEDRDVTVLRVAAKGVRGGEPLTQVYDLVDFYDEEAAVSSMARTTGFTASAVARSIAQGIWTERGVSAPEIFARNGAALQFVRTQLEARGVCWRVRREPVVGGVT